MLQVLGLLSLLQLLCNTQDGLFAALCWNSVFELDMHSFTAVVLQCRAHRVTAQGVLLPSICGTGYNKFQQCKSRLAFAAQDTTSSSSANHVWQPGLL